MALAPAKPLLIRASSRIQGPWNGEKNAANWERSMVDDLFGLGRKGKNTMLSQAPTLSAPPEKASVPLLIERHYARLPLGARTNCYSTANLPQARETPALRPSVAR
jgi:hypothetical protein